jgi:predicted ATPase
VAGYRSIRDLRVPLGPINVLVGPNGCRKSNLYRAIYLLAAAADGRFARTIAKEGGMPSILWAGARSKGPARMTLGVQIDELGYELECGLIPPAPLPGGSAFNLDPHVKHERLWIVEGRRPVERMRRADASVHARDDQGSRVTLPLALSESESVLAELREPHRFPVLAAIRQEFVSWRFYHQFRTDLDSPIRRSQVGVRTPVLAHDGRDLAAALRTIIEVGDAPALEEVIRCAFPGAELIVRVPTHEDPLGGFGVAIQFAECRRPLEARELSDGTLHFLCLLAALLSPRPPSLLALNEPEASIHSDLIDPIARLIVNASRHSQLWITTHSVALAAAIRRASGVAPITLAKVDGANQVVQA